MAVKILVIEDDELLQDSIVRILKSKQYTAFGAHNLKQGKLLFQKEQPDIVLLDIMLPDGKGFELLPLCTASSKVIIMTALTDRESKYLCYEHGVEDYLIKNFDLQELLYKIDVTYRNISQEEITLGDIIVDIKNLQIIGEEKSIDVPHSQIELLKSLYKKHKGNTLLPKDEIVPFGAEGVDESARIQNLIARLRKNIRYVKSEKVFIETIYGKGYRLVIVK